ncbi:hypothetical protein SLS55_006415 [Diplodia seriata]|uniref:Uncharacterized protein n=1 Tax=Diplodia seriata TaxID=420778 RepID=A0ABR3CE53_9PEZI
MNMSGRSDIATSVGIWVAVAVVAVAVVVVGGPLLIYKASKTERHQALRSVRDSSGYIGQGLGLSESFRVLRRVNAPILAYEPNFTGVENPDPLADRHSKASSIWSKLRKVFTIKDESPRHEPVYHGDSPLQLKIDSPALKCQSPTSWVRLGKLLEAYPQLTIEKGDALRIEKNQTFLPVHRLWILTFGLAGRYGDRSEDSIVTGSARLRAAASPGHHNTLGGPPVMQPVGQTPGPLRGITGTIVRCHDGPSLAYRFIAHDRQYLESIEPDTLSLRSLFWLALGAIPAGEGNIYSIVDPEPPKTWPSPGGNGLVVQPNADGHIAMASISRQTLVDSEHRNSSNSQPRIRYCRLVQINNIGGPPLDILNRFGGSNQTLHGLEEVPLDLHNPPSPIPWVILPYTSPSATDDTIWKLQCKDAQLLALRLLELPWHPEGYLFGRDRTPRLWRFFTTAASDLHDLLEHTRMNLHSIAKTEQNRGELSKVLDPAIRARNRQDLDRGGTDALFKAYEVFTKSTRTSQAERIIGELVSVLFITDPDFRNLVMQSCKHLSLAATTTAATPRSSSSTTTAGAAATAQTALLPGMVITFSRHESTVLVPGAFGVQQSFHVDLEGLYPPTGSTMRFFREEQGRDNIQAGLRVVILAALRAGCVSALLRGAWSSEALFQFFADHPEGVVFS